VGTTHLRYLAAAACVLVAAGGASSALGASGLLPSGGFEAGGSGSLAGWKGTGAVLSLRSDGRGGGHAVRIARAPGNRTYSIVAAPAPATAVAGRRYRAAGYIRSGTPGRRVCVKLVEVTPAGHTAGYAAGCLKATATWRAFPAAAYTAKHSGDAISFRVVQTSAAAPGDSFQVDDLSLTSPSADSAAPSQPSGVTAQATSSTRVALAWHASTDATGVAGYTIYRGGVFVATVPGSATAYTDTGRRSGTRYVYAVDAFDASGNRSPRSAGVSVTTFTPGDPVIAAAGDIACDPTASGFNGGSGTSSKCAERATSDLVLANPSIAAVLALGDNQYGCGGYTAFQQSFAPTWGRFLAKIHPVAGNHEYQTSGGSDCAPNAAGYFRYFGAAAGNAQGDYAWNIGAWHMIALNGECGNVGGCNAGSAQGRFLQANLGSSRCTLAYWHEPYYKGSGSPASAYTYFWNTLHAAGADIVLNGHIHTYARFAPQDANGDVDTADGMREFIVGTGGEDKASPPGSTNVQFTAKAFGLLELTLHPASYDWKFVSVDGSVLDSGSAACN
jgi:acid phosphatase type 7